MFDTVLPNCLARSSCRRRWGSPTAILDAASLGFLGLGAQPPTPEWGTMLAGALQYYQRAWWVLAFPGLAILLTVLAFNLFGDGLRDALDPKLAPLMALLEIRNLTVEFPTARGRFRAVDGSDLTLSTPARSWRGRRVRIGQERVDAGGHGADRLSGRRHGGRAALRRRRPADLSARQRRG